MRLSTLAILSSFIKHFLAQLAIISLILEQFIFVSTAATAQTLPITPDGTTNTQVTGTASGIDQINIAAPNSSGLSHNKFESYNVNAGGQIINNFSGNNSAEIAAGSGATAVTQTQIGGLVTANPNLVSSGSAKVILNEVASGNTSQLLGYTEIAGTKADLILANPNGITCAGCGFINTARLLMVAGSSNFDSSGNLGFNLKEQANPNPKENLLVPLITIDGLGLDVTRTSGTEIVASSVKLLSSIFGSDSNSVEIRTGEGRARQAPSGDWQIDPNGQFEQDAGMSEANPGNNPVFAIDASALAQIQAGQVYIIATKQGVGVKMESEILASQTLNLDANGDIYYKSISVGDTANLRSSGTIQTVDSSSSISAPTINITANQFNNSGLASAYNLNVQNSGTLNNSGNLEALSLNLSNVTNINNSGSIFGQNSLAISGTNLTNSPSPEGYGAAGNSSGSIYSPQSYTIALTGLLANSGLITSGNNLTLNSNQLNNSGLITSANNLSVNSNQLNNSGLITSANNLSVNSNQLSNSSEISAQNNLTFSVTTSANNSGSLSSLGSLTVSSNSNINNTNQILSNGTLSITAANLTSSNLIQSNGDLSLNLVSLTNTNNIVSGGAFTIAASGNISNGGILESADNFTINASSFSNS